MKKELSLLITGLSVAAAPQFAMAAQPDHPNVIYVFPDQFRNHAMGFWSQNDFRDKVNFKGDPVHTPNIDRFARESLVLTSVQSNCPLSSPHRGSLLTGMYPNESGVPLNCHSARPISSLREDRECISDVFAGAGYDCAYFGKLHTDYPTKNNPQKPGEYVESRIPAWDAYTPKERRHGFNYWYSYGTFDVHKNPHYWDNDGKRHDPHEWSPLHEAKEVVKYLRNENGVRNPERPFFIMVGMNPPHVPCQSLDDVMEEDYNLYKNMTKEELLVRPNADRTMTKADWTPYYFAAVTGVDRAFGQILDTLKELGLDNNTIVVFASDHGETMCSQGIQDSKNSPYAEAMNTPFIVRYPGHIKPHTDDLLLSSPDIMPTMIGLAGLGERIPGDLHGKDYSALFINPEAKVERPAGALYIQNLDGEKNAAGEVISYFPSARGYKTHDYTIAFFVDKKNRHLTKTLLFHDSEDPYQMTNLPLEANGEIVAKLCKEMAAVLKEINDPWYEMRILPDLIPYED